MGKHRELMARLLDGSGVSFDTRTILPGNVFFALQGEHADGNKYASEALEKGASVAVVSACPEEDSREGYLQVDDVLESMHILARDYRRYLGIPVLAITGSNGKTTNKNLLTTALSQRYKVHSTVGNYNNHIGLPVTILNTPLDAEFLILEMGTNHFGEIRTLCSIAEPDFGSILNVGKTHLEFLESVEGVMKAKAELADYLLDHNGRMFLNREEKSLDPLHDHPVDKVVFDRNSLPDTEYVVEVDCIVPHVVLRLRSEKEGRSLTLKSSLWGDHNVQNLIHAIAVSSYFGIKAEDTVKALSNYVPQNNRSQIVSWKGHKVYLDAYNANPTSMVRALRSFRMAHPTEGALILGQMGELGATAEDEHKTILKLIEEMGFQQVWLIGELFKEAGGDRYPQFNFRPEVSLVKEAMIKDGEPILIKGSRSMALERLVSK